MRELVEKIREVWPSAYISITCTKCYPSNSDLTFNKDGYNEWKIFITYDGKGSYFKEFNSYKLMCEYVNEILAEEFLTSESMQR